MLEVLPTAVIPAQPFLSVPPTRIGFAAAPTALAQQSLERLARRHGNVEFGRDEVVVCLGDDGFPLETLHRLMPATPDCAVPPGHDVGPHRA